MKLIDRDELLRNIEADIDISVTGVRNMEAVKCCLQNILDDVKDSPVVDAVPVEFIKGEIKDNKGFYNSSLRRLLDVWAERKEENGK